MPPFEFAILEWLWDIETIKVYYPDHSEESFAGSYGKIAETLSILGEQGWDVASTTAGANWILWTLKRPI